MGRWDASRIAQLIHQSVDVQLLLMLLQCLVEQRVTLSSPHEVRYLSTVFVYNLGAHLSAVNLPKG